MSHNNKYYKLITSNHNLWDLKLREVWKYRDLIILFTKRNFQITYKQTILGPAWLLLIQLYLIYCFIFGGIAGMDTDGIPQMLFYLSGNAIWTYFATCVTQNASTFTANANVFGKVYFPRLTTPISNVLTSIVTFLIQMVVIFNVLYNKWISYAEFTNMFYNSNYFNTVRYNGDGNRNYCIQFNN